MVYFDLSMHHSAEYYQFAFHTFLLTSDTDLSTYTAETPFPLDGDSAAIRNFGQNDTNRSRNGKSAAESQEKRLGRSRSVSEFQILYRKDTKAQRKRSSIAKVVARSQLHRHQRRPSVARSSLS